MSKSNTSVGLKTELHGRLKALSKERGVPMQTLIEQALEDTYFSDNANVCASVSYVLDRIESEKAKGLLQNVGFCGALIEFLEVFAPDSKQLAAITMLALTHKTSMEGNGPYLEQIRLAAMLNIVED